MSCCYNAHMGVKFKSEADKEKARVELAQFLRGGMDRWGREFSAGLDKFAEQGVTPDTFEGCIRVVLAGWKGQEVTFGEWRKDDGESETTLHPTDKAGFTLYCNGFDARYGWLNIMVEFFERLAKYVEDDSFFTVEYDNEYSTFTVFGGSANETESGCIDDDDEDDDEEDSSESEEVDKVMDKLAWANGSAFKGGV